VGITTYTSTTVCQGTWDVTCDGVLVGQINTNGRACTGQAMTNGCSTTFTARLCSTIRLTAVADGNVVAGCCGGAQPDSMIVGVSAW
jgi:hypothetical protein